MGIQLPPELADVAHQTGVRWPQADEDKMRQQATAYREAAGKITTLSGDADAAAHGALNHFQGSAADAARGHWDTFVAPDTGHLPATAQGCHAAADRLEHAADQVSAHKVELVRQLTSAAKQTNAAQHAASAGFPGALAGLHTTLQGTAGNVAALHQNLTQSVRLDSGVTVQGANLPIGQGHGGHGQGALGGLTDAAGTTLSDTGRGLGQTAHAATGGANGLTGDLGGTGGGFGPGFGHGHGADGGLGPGGFGPSGGPGLAGDGQGTGIGHLGRGVDQGVGAVTGWQDGNRPNQTAGSFGGGHGGGWGAGDPYGALSGGPEHHTGPIQLPGADQGPIGVRGASANPAPSAMPVFDGSGDSGPTSVGGSTGAGPGGGANASGGGPGAFGGATFGPDGAAVGGPVIGGAAPGGAAVGGAVGSGAPGGAAGGGAVPGGGDRGAFGAGPGPRAPQFGGAAAGPGGQGADGFVGSVGGGGLAGGRAPTRGNTGYGPGRPDDGYGMDELAAQQHDRPAKRSDDVVAFLLYLFPLGHLPVPATKPARQLPVPTGDDGFDPGGLRFEPQDHPRSDLVDDTAALHAALRVEPPVDQVDGLGVDHPTMHATVAGYDPLGGEHERDWDRRFLVRPADETTGQRAEYNWPPPQLFPEGGCDPEATEAAVLEPGTTIDRFGDPDGRVLSDAGALFAARSLPPAHRDHGYRQYRVLQSLPVWRTLSAPWFGQSGGAPRYRTTYPVADLVALGYLGPLEPPAPPVPVPTTDPAASRPEPVPSGEATR